VQAVHVLAADVLQLAPLHEAQQGHVGQAGLGIQEADFGPGERLALPLQRPHAVGASEVWDATCC
jgi:hypothetical protein